MTEEKIKFLALYIGRCPEPNCMDCPKHYNEQERIKCVDKKREAPTFKSDDDRRDLLRMMWKKGDWEKFYNYMWNYFVPFRVKEKGVASPDDLTFWLTLDPNTVEQVCELAYKFLSKEKK